MAEDAALAVEPRTLRFTRGIYDRMIDAGVFGPEVHIELLDGEIVQMAPQNSPHASALMLMTHLFVSGFGAGFQVRIQLPIALSEDSEPEPDVAIVRGQARDFSQAHPSRAELIVEIADTTLAYDRGRKRAAYAKASVPEYWIVNTRSRRLEVHRAPKGGDFSERFELAADETISPLAKPDFALRVADLLP